MGHIIDISKWDDDIDWDVAAPQLDLAICRVQYGSRVIDEKYKEYVANLEQRNIPHAAYAYGCYVSVTDAVIEAKDFMARTSPNAKFLVLDVEDDTLASCGPSKLAEASQMFINTCKAAGWKVGLYVSHHLYGSYGLQNVQADFLWIPRYGGKRPDYACDLWQYTDTGYVDGIGECDLNYIIGDKSLEWFIGGNDDGEIILPPDWQTNNLGSITIIVQVANVRQRPSLDAKVMRQVYKNSGHVYLDWYYDDSHFWYKIAENNWVRDDVAQINKDGKTKGVVWISGTNINLRKGASKGDPVVGQANVGAWDVHFRYEDWIYVYKEGVEGWMYFDESYVKWIR
ncbi:GH25 family lysozyme [Bacillus sp. NPDC077411]|uniref:GH25 family lysozyme n=1 Tax=Bacillus bruguierae TaxID=3127667 RepID=A0ABU8FHG5_9BACI